MIAIAPVARERQRDGKLSNYKELWCNEFGNRLKTYDFLLTATYHMIRGSEIVNCQDLSECSLIVAEIVRKIKPYAKQIEPYSKQLEYHLSQDFNND